jgi:hypothetical protein
VLPSWIKVARPGLLDEPHHPCLPEFSPLKVWAVEVRRGGAAVACWALMRTLLIDHILGGGHLTHDHRGDRR